MKINKFIQLEEEEEEEDFLLLSHTQTGREKEIMLRESFSQVLFLELGQISCLTKIENEQLMYINDRA